jgi:hypothetical protein
MGYKFIRNPGGWRFYHDLSVDNYGITVRLSGVSKGWKISFQGLELRKLDVPGNITGEDG